MIKAIIFDMDGVLIDAKEWHYEALNQALNIYGFNINRYDHENIYDGLPTNKKLSILSEKNGLPWELHETINKLKQQFTIELTNIHCKPYQIHIDTLESLKNHGYKLALASNSIRNSVNTMLTKANLYKYFDITLSTSEIKHPKPHPEIYETTIKKLGCYKNECVVVEDNENGIKAATSAGAHVLKVNTIHDVNLTNILEFIDSLLPI